MAKYLKLYEQESAYITDLGNNDLYVPNVAFCKDTNNVHYFSPAHESTALCSTSLRDGKIVKVKQGVSTMSTSWGCYVTEGDDNEWILNPNTTNNGVTFKLDNLKIISDHYYAIFYNSKIDSSVSRCVIQPTDASYIYFSFTAGTSGSVISKATGDYSSALKCYYGLNASAGVDNKCYLKLQIIDLTSMGLSTEAEFRSYLGLSDSDDIPYFEYGENEYIALSGKLYKLTYPLWMHYAHENYGIPYANMVSAYNIDNDIAKSFDGTGRWLQKGSTESYIRTNILLNQGQTVEVKFKLLGSESGDIFSNSLAAYGEDTIIVGMASTSQAFIYNKSSKFISVEDYDVSEISVVFGNASIDYTINDTEGSLSINNGVYGSLIQIFNRATTDYTGLSEISSFAIYEGKSLTNLFIPIKQTDGTCTMIDLMTMTYPTKVGTFTIE